MKCFEQFHFSWISLPTGFPHEIQYYYNSVRIRRKIVFNHKHTVDNQKKTLAVNKKKRLMNYIKHILLFKDAPTP